MKTVSFKDFKPILFPSSRLNVSAFCFFETAFKSKHQRNQMNEKTPPHVVNSIKLRVMKIEFQQENIDKNLLRIFILAANQQSVKFGNLSFTQHAEEPKICQTFI